VWDAIGLHLLVIRPSSILRLRSNELELGEACKVGCGSEKTEVGCKPVVFRALSRAFPVSSSHEVAELALDFWTRRSVVGSPFRVLLLDACTGTTASWIPSGSFARFVTWCTASERAGDTVRSELRDPSPSFSRRIFTVTSFGHVTVSVRGRQGSGPL